MSRNIKSNVKSSKILSGCTSNTAASTPQYDGIEKEYEEENIEPMQGYSGEVMSSNMNWKTCLVGCGSNAFGQLNSTDNNPVELMRSYFGPIRFPKVSNKNIVSNKSIESENIHMISCGANTSAIIFEKHTNECYLWGEGLSKPYLKVPTLFQISNKLAITQISCGQNHAGIITEDGKVLTWGEGEYGKLGHSNKQNVTSPKVIVSQESMFAIQISCGAFHTAIISAPIDEIVYISTLSSQSGRGKNGIRNNSVDTLRYNDYDSYVDNEMNSTNNTQYKCGYLYTCGLNKAGQLGLGESSSLSGKYNNNSGNSSNRISENRSNVSTPVRVKYFDMAELVIGQVACGFHHTLVLSFLKTLSTNRSASVYSFGFGDHGRLGLGDENQRSVPSNVKFSDEEFIPLQISAGEQHSLARGYESSYAWGCNNMGQLGAGNPTMMECAFEPIQIIIPEAMRLKSLVAGSRHSGALTYDGKILTWGWGEEGQLGHGSEKNSYLPRPCKLPRYEGSIGIPIDICLGNTHSLVFVKNPNYIETPESIQEESEEEVKVEEEQQKSIPIPIAEEEEEEDESMDYVEEPRVEAATKSKAAIVITDDDTILLTQHTTEKKESVDIRTPVRSVRDLLSLRDEREKSRESNRSTASTASNQTTPTRDPMVTIESTEQEEDNYDYIPMPNIETKPLTPFPPLPVDRDESMPPPSPYKHSPTGYPKLEQQSKDIHENIENSLQSDNVETVITTKPVIEEKTPKVDVFYRTGQNMDKCYVANSAKRAEIRKSKNLSTSPSSSSSSQLNSNSNANNSNSTKQAVKKQINGKSFKV